MKYSPDVILRSFLTLSNSMITPYSTYQYDVLYRLTRAIGREKSSLQMPTDANLVNHIPQSISYPCAVKNYTHRISL